MIQHIANNLDFRYVINSPGIVVVEFSAEWCGPCKTMSPLFVSLAEKHPGVNCYMVDVDKCPDISARYGISSLPSFITFKGGQRVSNTVVGDNPQALTALMAKVSKA